MTDSRDEVDPAKLRLELQALEPATQKVVGGLVVVMMRDADRIRDREWLLENLTVLSAKALELNESQTDELQEFVQRERDTALNAAFALFLRVAADVQGIGQAAEQPATLGQATAIALSYFE